MTMLAMKRGKPGESENTFLQLSNKMGEKIFKQLKLFYRIEQHKQEGHLSEKLSREQLSFTKYL